MGEKEPLVKRSGYLIDTAGIYNFLIYEWMHLKESSILIFLDLS